MAVSEKATESGYRLSQFIGEVSDDLLCRICKFVARESHSTNCCGEHFCKNCITQVLDASKPCPSCTQNTFAAIFPDIRDQKRILALQVCCTMKGRGCEWVGKLEDLQAHLLVDTNDCQYVDIQCPDKCGESIPKHQLPSHLTNSCLNRDYFCKYCNFSDTYRVVCYDHWPKCLHYPVQCPNACSVGAVERGDLEDHIKVCLLQEVSCDLCKEAFLREDEDRHMIENTRKHLLLMSATNQQMCQEFEQKLQEQREEKEREIKHIQQMLDESKQNRDEPITQIRKEFEQKLKEQREEGEREMKRMQQMFEESQQKREEQITQARKERDDQMRALEEKREQEIKALRENSDRAMKSLKDEKDRQIREIHAELESLSYQLQVQGIVHGTVRSAVQLQHVPYRCTPPVCFTVKNFHKLKTDNQQWTSPDLYTHEGGHMIRFTIHPNGTPNHITVRVSLHTKPGELDQHVEDTNPVKATITLQLLNQCRDRNHFDLTWECEWSKQSRPAPVTNAVSIPHPDLEWSHRRKTQYLKNDCLVFRLTAVKLNRKLCTIL